MSKMYIIERSYFVDEQGNETLLHAQVHRDIKTLTKGSELINDIDKEIARARDAAILAELKQMGVIEEKNDV